MKRKAMPYIKPERRSDLDPFLQNLWDVLIKKNMNAVLSDGEEKTLDEIKGDINYCMTKLLVTLLAKYGIRYHTLSAIVGIPSDVEHEFRRIYMNTYEDEKIGESGEIQPLEV